MSVRSVLEDMDIRYRLIEDEAWARCPYHSETHSSFSVNVTTGVFYCFACGAKGNFAKLIHDMVGLSYPEAVIYANETVGFAKMDMWRENYEDVSFSPQAIKVTEADMALFTYPPKHALEEKRICWTAAQHYGIKWNPEHQSWIFPYRDPYSGELWGWQEKNAHIFRNYPAGTKRGMTLFGIDSIEADIVALIESPVDCAVTYTAYAHPFYIGAVSSFGLPSLHQLSLIQGKVNHLVLALDNDKHGEERTRELLPEAIRMFKTVSVFNYLDFEGKDIGELSWEDINTGFDYSLSALEWMKADTMWSREADRFEF